MCQRTMSAPMALNERGRAWEVQFKLTNLDGPKLISPAEPVHLSFIRYEPGLILQCMVNGNAAPRHMRRWLCIVVRKSAIGFESGMRTRGKAP